MAKKSYRKIAKTKPVTVTDKPLTYISGANIAQRLASDNPEVYQKLCNKYGVSTRNHMV